MLPKKERLATKLVNHNAASRTLEAANHINMKKMKTIYLYLLNSRRAALCFLTASLLFIQTHAVYAYTDDDLVSEIKQLDTDFKNLASEIYQHEAKNLPKLKPSENDSELERLSRKVTQLIEQKDHFKGLAHLYANFDILEANVDDEYIIEMTRLLLSQNDFNTALRVKRKVNEYADQYFVSTISLLFAEYYNQRDDWRNVLSSLEVDIEELSSENTNHAYLLKGIALQNLKKHRDAIQFYEKVTKESQHYPLAQLNTAIAYIRQDWWTDAHIIIKRLLDDVRVTQNEELANRLALVLGFSLLNKEYYRESRESFRNISLESQYTNKALLGLSLAAIGQGDSLGALNTVTLLNKRKSYELVVEESYLLLPHIFKNLEQYETANSSYTVAINYYENRIDALNMQVTLNNEYRVVDDFNGNQKQLKVADMSLKFSEFYPPFLLQNFVKMQQIANRTKSPSLHEKAQKYIYQYNTLLQRVINELLTQRVAALQSYLSQAQFGIAQLYDKDHE